MGGDANMKTAILLSGGMDSISLAHWKRPDIAFTIDYGQLSAAGEIQAARVVSRNLGIPHELISVNCRELGSGDLAGKPHLETAPSSEWWPFRNQLLLTLAGTRAISLGINSLIFGSVKTDSFHKDGSAEFFEKISDVFFLQEGNLLVSAPAINLSTTELVKVSGIPRSLLAWAHSCHISQYACGHCGGCAKYYSVMKELGYETD
jgi:7-cyano-7-deazaguanine synthase